MKRLILLLALVILTCTGSIQHQHFKIAKSRVLSAPCTTPDNGDEFDEGFLGTGYENTWAETIGSGGTVNEDFTLSGSPPTGSCTEGLNVIASAAHSWAMWDRGSTIAAATNIDIYVSFYVDALTLDDGAVVPIFSWDTDTDPASLATFELRLRVSSGVITVYAASSVDSASVTISLDTWYEALIHLDVTAGNSYMRIDAGENKTFTRTTHNSRYFYLGALDNLGAGESIDVEFGYAYMNTP
jgi:hypothetical protein